MKFINNPSISLFNQKKKQLNLDYERLMSQKFRTYLAKLHRETFSYLKPLPFKLWVIGILVSGICLSSHSAVLACGGTGDTCNKMFARGIQDLLYWMFSWIFYLMFDLIIKGLIVLTISYAGIFGLVKFFDRKNR
ncbi:hypothetical protein [Richelia sinica]|uniref:hypothetical protein n=1 Tax=Richelia sinica TaxID=1357545 RepID=UPI0016872835|nr:hypothetical protein [Richelia sinica]MBD2665170.1 hypothetical protein [Richelia sinica FACHB-800]